MAKMLISAAKVAAACDSYLQQRAQRIESERERLIQARMHSFWRHLLGLRQRTRQEAIDHLKRETGHGIFSEWDMQEWRGGHWANIVEKIAALAKLALRECGEYSLIDLTDTEFTLLAEYWPR